MNRFHDDDKKEFLGDEKAFDFTAVNDYKSIYTYTKNTLKRQNHFEIDSESQNRKGAELIVSYIIICIFYLLMIVTFPFSLLVCLKKVKENETIVAYRLGRLISPAFKPGYCLLFPLIDSFQRLTIVQKEFSLLNLQILNYENSIVDTSTQIRYIINDVIKMTNSVQDLPSSLKSIARSNLINTISKKDTSKLENELYYLKQEFKNDMNAMVNKWGVDIVEAEISLNSIIKDESEASGEDPALKTIKSVFMSLFNRDSDDSQPKSSSASQPVQLPAELMSMFTGMMPSVIPNDFAPLNSSLEFQSVHASESEKGSPKKSESNLPFKLLTLLKPLLNESLIREIQTVYEFHIKAEKHANKYEEVQNDIFYLDLKTLPNGNIGIGPCLFSKVDCVIKLNDEDLNDLLTDKLKPFTAYMSGRIEIDGDLQDVFKLKKLIKSVTSAIGTNIKV
jgi:erythrocyte band 7 integral membrane protein